LMSHQNGFSNNGTEPSGSGKSDDDDDRMQKKSENVAHPQDGIKLRSPRIQGRLRNSPTTGSVLYVRPDGRQSCQGNKNIWLGKSVPGSIQPAPRTDTSK